ncbi:hypothetical protein JTB14_035091 [Gonioctena quinquepunctata]|nr:hypothetical protein JTB14_035091 [Gonioctena quinquepunctata]
MHGLGASIEYSRVLRLATAIANELLHRMECNGGLYVPDTLVKGRFLYCAADNLDFLEDTPDGKGTLHAKVMTCCQEHHDTDITEGLILTEDSLHNRTPQ